MVKGSEAACGCAAGKEVLEAQGDARSLQLVEVVKSPLGGGSREKSGTDDSATRNGDSTEDWPEEDDATKSEFLKRASDSDQRYIDWPPADTVGRLITVGRNGAWHHSLPL